MGLFINEVDLIGPKALIFKGFLCTNICREAPFVLLDPKPHMAQIPHFKQAMHLRLSFPSSPLHLSTPHPFITAFLRKGLFDHKNKCGGKLHQRQMKLFITFISNVPGKSFSENYVSSRAPTVRVVSGRRHRKETLCLATLPIHRTLYWIASWFIAEGYHPFPNYF